MLELNIKNLGVIVNTAAGVGGAFIENAASWASGEAAPILAFLNGELVGLGFNDVVLGDTVLTTVEGRVVQVSALEFMKGRKMPSPPSRAGTADSEVRLKRGDESQADIVIHSGVFGQHWGRRATAHGTYHNQDRQHQGGR